LGATDNLAVALRYLGQSTEFRTLWIDAICINQDDVTERGLEVVKMGSIYSQARQVIIWLGPEFEGSSDAVQLLRSLVHSVEIVSLLGDVVTIKGKEVNWSTS